MHGNSPRTHSSAPAFAVPVNLRELPNIHWLFILYAGQNQTVRQLRVLCYYVVPRVLLANKALQPLIAQHNVLFISAFVFALHAISIARDTFGKLLQLAANWNCRRETHWDWAVAMHIYIHKYIVVNIT